MGYDADKTYAVMMDIKEEGQKIKPYLAICQPKRSENEGAIQTFNDPCKRDIDIFGYSFGYSDIFGKPVDVARNWLIEGVLAAECKYLLFVDSDVALPYDAWTKLHKTAKENPDTIIVGVYYFKMGTPMVFVREDKYIVPADVTPGKLADVYCAGLGCALIPTSILRKMKEEAPEVPYSCTANGEGGLPVVGEDEFFFHRARKLGFKILMNTDVQCLHVDLTSGKYTAHPSVNLNNYRTNIPITTPITLDDRERLRTIRTAVDNKIAEAI